MQATVHGITGITSPNASGFDLLPVAPRGLVFLPVIPGTQRYVSGPATQNSLNKNHFQGAVNMAYYANKDYGMSLPRESVEMKAGDFVFYHPCLFHGSGASRSDGFSCHDEIHARARIFNILE
ncbi:phytanoyl-CoA dioxygenase [Caenorhabditis elegans]|uniref:phytanoyl-CoA dioxygenase n=1 Tax=Caenorhabditis elegans TaxID=6239 RepID=G4SG26_CAEEL|nr:phytanoyl-CoA dioxygenase [Caenorhabditis elegans]CCD70287.1 phytanoyl-CoA dioxygenase [Caenorhabditis elegans]|eukprot:NP_001254053.1 Uncharacterized protein CELE_F42G2.7 [Caenorhabditis elegans]